MKHRLPKWHQPLASAVVVALASSLLSAQTAITPPKNKYTLAQDVELGRKAADEARRTLPILKDDAVTSYIARIGDRLVEAAPANLKHPEFKYTFEAVNVREINAFALPGGPMFVNRGMIEAANSEGEVAGVMAHEISHVLLRHGTAQASKATKFEIGQLLGAIGGAVVGGAVGSVIAQGTQFGLGAAFLRYGRDYEKQADLLGAQIMSKAGYDAAEMANMFKTIEKQGGSNGPEWLSDHPNPGNRYEYILKEAETLKVANPIRNSEDFARIKEHLKTLPKAPTTEEATKSAKRGGTTSGAPRPTGRAEPPSSRYQSYSEGGIFTISVPSNWRELAGSNAVTFAPAGAYGDFNGQSVFTHGVEVGVSRQESHDLRTATDELLDSLRQGNPRMTQGSEYRDIAVDGRSALQTSVGNMSEVTGREEVVWIATTQVRSGDLFYVIGVAPRDEMDAYQAAFQRIVGSIRLKE